MAAIDTLMRWAPNSRWTRASRSWRTVHAQGGTEGDVMEEELRVRASAVMVRTSIAPPSISFKTCTTMSFMRTDVYIFFHLFFFYLVVVVGIGWLTTIPNLDMMFISASTQSGQSRSPQKRNLCHIIIVQLLSSWGVFVWAGLVQRERTIYVVVRWMRLKLSRVFLRTMTTLSPASTASTASTTFDHLSCCHHNDHGNDRGVHDGPRGPRVNPLPRRNQRGVLQPNPAVQPRPEHRRHPAVCPRLPRRRGRGSHSPHSDRTCQHAWPRFFPFLSFT